MHRPEASLADVLGTRVLENIAALEPAAVLRGQADGPRLSRRRRFPRVDFYGEERMRGGLPGHRHERPELATVLDGRLNLVIDNVVYEARRADWLVFGANVLHGECCLTTHVPYELLWFVAHDDQRVGVHRTRYTRARGYEVLATHRLGRMPADVQSDLRRLCTQPWTSVPESRRRLVRLVSWALDRFGAQGRETASRRHPLVEEARQQLEAATGRPPSVVELANHVGLSPNYLSNLFHQETGLTIRRFVESLRMERARRLLADPQRSIKQIAYELDFADPHHFSHAFRRATGASPTAFRRRLTEESDT